MTKNRETTIPSDSDFDTGPVQEISTVNDKRFSEEISTLIAKAEDMRLAHSRSYDRRRTLYHVALSLLVTGTATYLVWLFLMGGNMTIFFAAFAATIIIPLLLNMWSQKPVRTYIRDYKASFLPALAKAMGNLTFRPSGGISMKALAPAQIMPPHDSYTAEDCFTGVFKGVKLMISEARLNRQKNKTDPVWDGVLVLLMTPKKKFKGHTIITLDKTTARRWLKIRWKTLQEVTPAADGPALANFLVISDMPEEAVQLADHDLMGLLNRLSVMFDNSALSAVFYGGNKVLLSIPYKGDMFEPGDIYMPVSSQKDMLKSKKEIEQILEAIDIIDVYEPDLTIGSGDTPDGDNPA